MRILACLILLYALTGNAQGYFEIFGDPDVDEYYFCAGMQDVHVDEIEDLFIYSVYDDLSQPTWVQGFVGRLAQNGQSTTVQLSSTESTVSKLFSYGDGDFLCLEVVGDEEDYSHEILIHILDEDLELIESFSQSLPDTLLTAGLSCGIHDELGYSLVGTTVDTVQYSGELHFTMLTLQMSQDLEEIVVNQHSAPPGVIATMQDMTRGIDATYKVLTHGWTEDLIAEPAANSTLHVTTLDSNLTPLYTYQPEVDSPSHPQAGLQQYQDSLFICLSDRFTSGFPLTNDMTVMKFDQDFNLLDSAVLGMSYNGENLVDKVYQGCLAQFSNGDLLVGSNWNWLPDVLQPFNENYRWLQLYRLDSELNVIWRKFYGGDMAYQLREVRAMSNGDVMALGDVYDFETYPDEINVDLFALRANGDGEITDLVDVSARVVDFALSPNPAYSECTISTSLNDYRIEVFDVQGRPIAVFNNPSASFSLPVDEWSPGQYLLKVESEDLGIRFTERLVIQ